jgi:hypothetical protein
MVATQGTRPKGQDTSDKTPCKSPKEGAPRVKTQGVRHKVRATRLKPQGTTRESMLKDVIREGPQAGWRRVKCTREAETVLKRAKSARMSNHFE